MKQSLLSSELASEWWRNSGLVADKLRRFFGASRPLPFAIMISAVRGSRVSSGHSKAWPPLRVYFQYFQLETRILHPQRSFLIWNCAWNLAHEDSKKTLSIVLPLCQATDAMTSVTSDHCQLFKRKLCSCGTDHNAGWLLCQIRRTIRSQSGRHENV